MKQNITKEWQGTISLLAALGIEPCSLPQDADRGGVAGRKL